MADEKPVYPFRPWDGAPLVFCDDKGLKITESRVSSDGPQVRLFGGVSNYNVQIHLNVEQAQAAIEGLQRFLDAVRKSTPTE